MNLMAQSSGLHFGHLYVHKRRCEHFPDRLSGDLWLACVAVHTASLVLSSADGGSGVGTESGFAAYAGEEAVITGSVAVSFSPVESDDPGWAYLPPSVRGSVLVTSLNTANVTDYGDWQV